MHAEIHKPNWLFRGLMLLSVGVHLIVLIHLANIYRPNVVSRIELTLQSIKSRPQHKAVVPPAHSEQPEKYFDQQLSSLKNSQNIAIKAPHYQPPKPVTAERLQRLPSVPQIDDKSDPVATVWEDAPDNLQTSVTPEPVQRAVEASPSTNVNVIDRSQKNYTDLLRQKITQNADKEYKKRARRRNLEGVVTIEFNIGTLGELVSIKVVRTSGNKILDHVAKKAVQKAAPFDAPPGGSITISLPIKFEQRNS